MLPGQFVEIRVDGSSTTFLRRPISINYVDRELNELWLMVAMVGDGTRKLGELQPGDTLNCVLPLGNGFSLKSEVGSLKSDNSQQPAAKMLLVGGGVGVAPLLFLGAHLQQQGCEVTFLLGGRSAKDVLELELFNRYGRVCVTTEDGSLGEKGFVTNHSVLGEHFNKIFTCGPTPMMKAVARYAKEQHLPCEASSCVRHSETAVGIVKSEELRVKRDGKIRRKYWGAESEKPHYDSQWNIWLWY